MSRTLLIVLGTVLSCGVVLADMEELKNVRQKYLGMRSRIDADHSAALDAALGRYGQSLDESVKQYQSQGDLEAVLSLMGEKKRFEQARKVPRAIPADAHESLLRLRQAYQGALGAAEARRSAALPVLLESYMKKLEGMKRQYTREGRLEEALAVKAEIGSVGQGGVVTVAPAEPDPVAEAASPPVRDTARSRSRVTPETPRPKTTVNAQAEFLERQKTLRGARRKTSSHRSRPTESLEEGMDAYRSGMNIMAAKFQAGEADIVDFEEVKKRPGDYEGRVLRSGVYIRSAFARGVTVSHRANGTDTIEMIPHSMSIGKAAASVFGEIGAGGMAVVTYGVVSEKNFTLFDMNAL